MKTFIIFLIKWYRRSISPYSKPHCKYYPTCSQYGLEAVERFGAVVGVILTVWRILRCNPFAVGGYDPVPQVKSK